MRPIIFFNTPLTATGSETVQVDWSDRHPYRIYEAYVTGTGAVAATVELYGSTNGTYFPATPFATITLSGTTSSADNFTSTAPYQHVKAVVTSITGTGAAVTGSIAA